MGEPPGSTEQTPSQEAHRTLVYSLSFIIQEGSFPCSQEPTTCVVPELDESNPRHLITFT
jgi:hypothetical protein